MREVVSGTLLKSNNIVYVLGAIGPKQDWIFNVARQKC
jgi:hypothetical protein